MAERGGDKKKRRAGGEKRSCREKLKRAKRKTKKNEKQEKRVDNQRGDDYNICCTRRKAVSKKPQDEKFKEKIKKFLTKETPCGIIKKSPRERRRVFFEN